jgi:sugar phosphate isomerase/epimerase
MKRGIGSYTYTWAVGVPGSMPPEPMSVGGLIRKAVELCADCIQVADNLPMTGMKLAELETIRSLAESTGIEMEIGTRGLTEENLHTHIELAEFFKSPILRIVIDKEAYVPDLDTILAVIRNAERAFSRAGIVLAIENHDRLPAKIFRDIMERLDSPCVGICLDCVNSMGIGEGIDTVLENLAPYTVNLHVKDFVVRRLSHKMGFLIEGVPAGRGFLNLQHLLERLQSYGRCKSAILELWTPPAETLTQTLERENEWAIESMAYIKEMLNGIQGTPVLTHTT